MTREELFEAMVGIDEERLEHSEHSEKEYKKKKSKKFFPWAYLGTAAACIGLIGIATNYFLLQPLLYKESLTSEVAEEFVAGISDVQEQESDRAAKGGVENSEQEERNSENLGEKETYTVTNPSSFWLNGIKYTAVRYEEYKAYEFTTESAKEEISQGESMLYAESRSENLESGKEKIFFEESALITEEKLGEVMGIIEESEDPELIGCIVYHWISDPDSDTICIVKRKDSYRLYTMEKEEE